MKPNKNFELSVNDVRLIEECLRIKLTKLQTLRLTHVESTIVPESEIQSVKEIDFEMKEINDLLGRLHNQKNWYRPDDGIYIGG